MPRRRYLIRFDDISPCMNWEIWNEVEPLLEQYGIRPILAVIPDNQDPALTISPPRADFWEKVRLWQSQGWAIALHGHKHVYVNRNPGIMKLTNQSEFAGLPREEQHLKLRQALEVFEQEKVRADLWVAPSHSFDRTTLDVLSELNVNVISDGLWPWPYTDKADQTWIPQQLWDFKPMKAGVWTVCYHHNDWSSRDLERFKLNLARFHRDVTDLSIVLDEFRGRRMTLRDRVAAWYRWTWKLKIRTAIATLYRRASASTRTCAASR